MSFLCEYTVSGKCRNERPCTERCAYHAEPISITKAEFDSMLQGGGDPASKLFSKVEGHFYGVKA